MSLAEYVKTLLSSRHCGSQSSQNGRISRSFHGVVLLKTAKKCTTLTTHVLAILLREVLIPLEYVKQPVRMLPTICYIDSPQNVGTHARICQVIDLQDYCFVASCIDLSVRSDASLKSSFRLWLSVFYNPARSPILLPSTFPPTYPPTTKLNN